MRRRIVLVGVGIAVGIVTILIAGTLAKGFLVAGSGNRDVGAPPTAKLLPIPEDTTVVVDKAFRGEGSLGAGRRLLALDTSRGQRSATQVTSSYLQDLRRRGWSVTDPTAALSPDSEICLTAVPMNEYLADADRPEVTKQLLRELGRPAELIGVITAIFC